MSHVGGGGGVRKPKKLLLLLDDSKGWERIRRGEGKGEQHKCRALNIF